MKCKNVIETYRKERLHIDFCCDKMAKLIDDGYVKVNQYKETDILIVKMYYVIPDKRFTLISIRYCPFCGNKINEIENY